MFFTTKPIHLCVERGLFLVSVTAQYSGVPAAVIPLGASTERAIFPLKEQIIDDLHLFQDAVSSVSFLMRLIPVLC